MTNETTDVSTRALCSLLSTYYSVEHSQCKVGGSEVGRKGQEGRGRDYTTNTKKVCLLACQMMTFSLEFSWIT